MIEEPIEEIDVVKEGIEVVMRNNEDLPSTFISSKNYQILTIKMKSFLRSKYLWHLVQDGFKDPLVLEAF